MKTELEKNSKQLLIRDICARLPYGVYIKFKQYNEPLYLSVKDKLSIYNGGELINNLQYLYLRPMSSMTEEEKGELKEYLDAEEVDCNGFGYIEGGTLEDYISSIPYSLCNYVIDWLNEHHFDYRGLIPTGLALEATKDMYNI